MQEMFLDPFFHALRTEHSHLAVGSLLALRYPADILPFAGLSELTPEAMLSLAELLAPSEDIYLTGDDIPATPHLELLRKLPVLQFQYPPGCIPEAAPNSGIIPLTSADAPDMVALTDVAFPGFYRPRTYLLGSYFGIRIDGELIAMAGERVSLPGHREISALCTHPSHTGKGYAAALTIHLLCTHAAAGLRSFLHVAANNHRAIALYNRLGFLQTGEIALSQLRRR